MLLEEQTSRNALLEKKQRKFDAEIGSLNEQLKREMDARDKVARELDEAKRNKFLLEDQVQVGGSTTRREHAPLPTLSRTFPYSQFPPSGLREVVERVCHAYVGNTVGMSRSQN